MEGIHVVRRREAASAHAVLSDNQVPPRVNAIKKNKWCSAQNKGVNLPNYTCKFGFTKESIIPKGFGWVKSISARKILAKREEHYLD